MAKKQDYGFEMLAVISIIAIVGLVFMFMNTGGTSSLVGDSESENLVGEAKGIIGIDDCCSEYSICKRELGTCTDSLINLESDYETLQSEVCNNFPEACGCMKPDAYNYDSNAIIDDGSCEQFIVGTGFACNSECEDIGEICIGDWNDDEECTIMESLDINPGYNTTCYTCTGATGYENNMAPYVGWSACYYRTPLTSGSSCTYSFSGLDRVCKCTMS